MKYQQFDVIRLSSPLGLHSGLVCADYCIAELRLDLMAYLCVPIANAETIPIHISARFLDTFDGVTLLSRAVTRDSVQLRMAPSTS
jgi:hypothetical protein